ncbi:reverse transcriptase domain-containing protein [Tanacetum coccineum]|uniref:Reverse transcriptase domain-containing protein n=1 Tax=Tanacetum coccineum TaxID=301880 RepID=A0ABQ5CWK3_9ASTR
MPGCSWRGHLRGAHIHYCPVFLEGTPARGTYSLLPGVLGGDTCEGHIFITARCSWRGHLRGAHIHYCPVFLEGTPARVLRPPPARNEHVNVVFTRSAKSYDPPVNPNDKPTLIHDDSDDEDDEAERKEEPFSSKPTQSDMIKEVRINVPLVDILVGMPNYRKLLKDLVSNKSKMEKISAAFLNEECSGIVQNKLPPKLGDPRSFLIPCIFANSVECLALADLDASINLMPYSLYTSLSVNTLKATRMSILLPNHTFQYPMRVVENMLVQVGKFIFPVDFVILEMEVDNKVHLFLGRPFLHTVNAIIRVKSKELNLGVGDDGINFLIDKAMQHSHFSDDTCFCIDVIDEVTEEELDALLNDSEPLMKILEQEEEIDDTFEELPLEEKLIIKTSIQESPTDLEMKPYQNISNMIFWKKILFFQ